MNRWMDGVIEVWITGVMGNLQPGLKEVWTTQDMQKENERMIWL